jgi:hypothetical protein
MQATLVVVDKDATCDVHTVYKTKAFLDATGPQALVHLRGDIDKLPAAGHVEPQFLAIAFHDLASSRCGLTDYHGEYITMPSQRQPRGCAPVLVHKERE